MRQVRELRIFQVDPAFTARARSPNTPPSPAAQSGARAKPRAGAERAGGPAQSGVSRCAAVGGARADRQQSRASACAKANLGCRDECRAHDSLFLESMPPGCVEITGSTRRVPAAVDGRGGRNAAEQQRFEALPPSPLTAANAVAQRYGRRRMLLAACCRCLPLSRPIRCR
jgi:hypothetical protein